MRRYFAVALCGMWLTSSARGEELSSPPVMPTEQATPVLPPSFLERALRVDNENRITQGKSKAPITHRELFEWLGRDDLVAQSDVMATRRKWLLIGGAGIATVAAGVGIALIATGPNLASPACESDVRIYNQVCIPRAAEHNIAGTVVIGTGVVGGLLMAGLAYGSDPAVLNRDETSALVATWNAKLARELRGLPSSLRLLPMVTPQGAALAARFTF